MKNLFDASSLGRRVRVVIAYLDLDMRSAAKQIGCSHSTVSRICNGKPPDVENYLRVLAWLKKKEQ